MTAGTRRPRRSAPAAVAAVAALLLAGCSTAEPAAPAAAPDDCSWPDTSTPVQDGYGLAVSGVGPTELRAYRAATGELVGRCRFERAVSADPPLIDAAGQPVDPGRAGRLPRPPVAGPVVDLLPDNTRDPQGAPLQGGVRQLDGGRRVALGFTGWAVTTTIADRLLLARVPESRDGVAAAEASTDPADWCVLPEVTAPLTDCVAVPGATVPGTATVTPAGDVRWVPEQGVPAVVGAVPGSLAGDGADFTAGFVPETGPVLPGTLDGRALVGWDVGDGLTAPPEVRWSVRSDGAEHRSPTRAGELVDTFSGAQLSADGRTLTLIAVADAGGRECGLLRHRDDGSLPVLLGLSTRDRGVCPSLVAWPEADGAAA
ncbi:hypothetical protein GB931_10025 [Modestobacter sp. I12A-02628]|uniref:Uncharacterized protein n=1 Tax=Goekera deserti TaxID=2497753 RepID=A0A7K3WE68_9ACTN|nr:hypothetical protein [Goekera deserti]MPQ98248.1 hypothetical protein [Goekera deserti]NDI48074.1 hypothetical protein [Goekera deserti]NEL53823.1 hypothetical protein [Goekera deserti]